MSEELYHIKFPKTEARFMDNELTFSINHIKSRELSTLYFTMKCYDMNNTLIYTYVSDRWIISPTYTHKETTFNLPLSVAESTAYYEIELITSGITSENPLYFNQVMLNEGEYTEYHIPKETDVAFEVKFNKNSYANLYNGDSYLQVIRPQKDKFLTNLLTKSNCTVLAPHLSDEPVTDEPVTVFLEFINHYFIKINLHSPCSSSI